MQIRAVRWFVVWLFPVAGPASGRCSVSVCLWSKQTCKCSGRQNRHHKAGDCYGERGCFVPPTDSAEDVLRCLCVQQPRRRKSASCETEYWCLSLCFPSFILPRLLWKGSFFFFFLPLWLIPVTQSRRSGACCQEKFVWMLKNVEEGLACTMSFAFPLKMLGEKSEGFHL